MTAQQPCPMRLPLGDGFGCQLPGGHPGPHQFGQGQVTVTWVDDWPVPQDINAGYHHRVEHDPDPDAA